MSSQWRVWCQGVVGSAGCGSGGCAVCGGWLVWVVLRLVWKLDRVVAVARAACRAVVVVAPTPGCRVMAWVSIGCGLISMKVAWFGAGRGDGLAEPHRVAHVGDPVLGVEQRLP